MNDQPSPRDETIFDAALQLPAGQRSHYLDEARGADAHPDRDVQAHMVVAMAHHQLQHANEARTALAKGVEIADTKLAKLESGDLSEGWNDWIIAHALMREARGLIEVSSAQTTEAK